VSATPTGSGGLLIAMANLVVVAVSLVVISDYVGCDPKSSYGRSRTVVSDEQKIEKKPGFRLWSEGPNFDTDLPQDVSGVVGQTAYLTCRVFDRENKTISWIRHRDLHILTVGRYTYTADLRYQSIFNSNTDQWILQIKNLSKRDSGMYECQVSTQPVRSFFVRLNILDELPYDKLLSDQTNISDRDTRNNVVTTVILGGSEVHVESGSTLNLTCVVKHNREPQHYLLWYHRGKTIDYTSPRGGISVVNSDDSAVEQTSTLLIYQVEQSDSGKYTCNPSNADSSSITVYVIEDEHQENLKSKSSSCGLIPSAFLLVCLVICCKKVEDLR